MSHITITLPLPPKVLHPNGRTRKYRYKAAATKAYRFDCGLAVVDAMNRARLTDCPWKCVMREARFFFRTVNPSHFHDPSNLNAWIKAADDALQDAGLIVDDRHLTPLPPVAIYGADGPRVELFVEKD